MKLDRQREVEHLSLAERHITEGQMRITAQQLRVDTLRGNSSEDTLAEQLLDTLEGTLAQWRIHREQILRRLATIDLASRLPGS